MYSKLISVMPERITSVIDTVLGSNSYKARTGVFTGGANAVYWMNIAERSGETIKISNIPTNELLTSPFRITNLAVSQQLPCNIFIGRRLFSKFLSQLSLGSIYWITFYYQEL